MSVRTIALSLEERVAVLESETARQRQILEDIDGKLDRLVAAANMGRGAWWLILRIGGLIMAGVGIYAAFSGHIHFPGVGAE